MGDFDYEKEEFSDPKEVKAEGDLVREAARLVIGNGLSSSNAKESADLITASLADNEEKRRDSAPPEAGASTVIEKTIDETASTKDQGQKAPEEQYSSNSEKSEKPAQDKTERADKAAENPKPIKKSGPEKQPEEPKKSDFVDELHQKAK